MRLVAASLAAGVIGFVAGRIGLETAKPAAAPLARIIAAPVTCRATLAAADVDMLKRELLSALAATATPPPSPPPPEDPAAGEAARELLDRALAAGTWSDDDRLALTRALSGAGPDARRQALIRLTTAINQQRVQVMTSGSPL